MQGGEITRLDSGCTIIGAFETLPDIKMGEVKLKHPGTIFACTDGLTDVTNEMGAFYDDPHIEEILYNPDHSCLS